MEKKINTRLAKMKMIWRNVIERNYERIKLKDEIGNHRSISSGGNTKRASTSC
jgi:hypothetical protein